MKRTILMMRVEMRMKLANFKKSNKGQMKRHHWKVMMKIIWTFQVIFI